MNHTSNPLVSIIVASYNYEKYISETLVSLINQTYKNIEIIVIDDGSSDNSINIIKNYQKQDPRIKLITHPNNENKGLAFSVKTAIENASGEYIAFCESDDYFALDHIEKKIKYINKYPNADIIINKPLMFGDNDKIKELQNGFASLFYQLEKIRKPKIYFYEMEFTWTFPTFSTVMVRKECFSYCDFNSKPTSAIDIWLWKQITTKYKVGFVNEFLTYWRIHKDSLANTGERVPDLYWKNLNQILYKNKEFKKYIKLKHILRKIARFIFFQEVKNNFLITYILRIPFKKNIYINSNIWNN